MSHRNILLPVLTVVGVLVLSTIPSLGQTVDPNLNIPQLVRDAYRNGAEMSKRIFQYTWTDTRTYRVVEKGGKVKTYPEQVYEVFPNRVNGKLLLRRLVRENGVPLPPSVRRKSWRVWRRNWRRMSEMLRKRSRSWPRKRAHLPHQMMFACRRGIRRLTGPTAGRSPLAFRISSARASFPTRSAGR